MIIYRSSAESARSEAAAGSPACSRQSAGSGSESAAEPPGIFSSATPRSLAVTISSAESESASSFTVNSAASAACSGRVCSRAPCQPAAVFIEVGQCLCPRPPGSAKIQI